MPVCVEPMQFSGLFDWKERLFLEINELPLIFNNGHTTNYKHFSWTYSNLPLINNAHVLFAIIFQRDFISALVTALDDAVGDIVQALKKKDIYNNTVIIFTTDVNTYDKL